MEHGVKSYYVHTIRMYSCDLDNISILTTHNQLINRLIDMYVRNKGVHAENTV